MQFPEILKGADAEGKEKHVPTIEVIKDHGSDKLELIHVMVGKQTPHPNTVEHHIAWVEVFGVKRDTSQVVSLGRASFGPGLTSPNISFNTSTSEFKAICALSYCNVHGLWQSCLEL